jgi:hypothetical protein
MYCKLFDTNLSGYREDVTHDFDPIRCIECIAELEIKECLNENNRFYD